MKRTARSIVAFFCIAMLLDPMGGEALSQTAGSPTPDLPAPNAPVPPQIASSKTVFLSNAGADTGFPIDPTQVYNDVYKALQTWGRYKLVSSPEQADLVFKLRDMSTFTTYGASHGTVYTVNSPSFQLAIVDPKANATLWMINSPVALAGSKQKLARWISISETNLVSRIKVVAGETLTPMETADLTTVPKVHSGRAGLIILGGVVAIGVGAGLLIHHEYENSLASQKASQDAFCNANHIPLSECPGG
jgi:hypothetical protein